MPVVTPPLPHPVAALHALALARGARIERTCQGDKTYWIKRLEVLPWRMRLQKGNPDRALSCEALALRELGARGLPVPDLVVEGPGFLVIADCGPSLNLMVRDVGIPSAEKLRAMTAAGAALARLHYAGVVHGRPSIRDFCWDGDQITLIDWERYRPHANTRFRMRVDAVIFVFNLYALLRGNTPELIVAIDAYRAKAPPGLWDEAARLCRRLAIFDLLTKRQQRRDAGRGEFRAIPLTLRRFRAP